MTAQLLMVQVLGWCAIITFCAVMLGLLTALLWGGYMALKEALR